MCFVRGKKSKSKKKKNCRKIVNNLFWGSSFIKKTQSKKKNIFVHTRSKHRSQKNKPIFLNVCSKSLDIRLHVSCYYFFLYSTPNWFLQVVKWKVFYLKCCLPWTGSGGIKKPIVHRHLTAGNNFFHLLKHFLTWAKPFTPMKKKKNSFFSSNFRKIEKIVLILLFWCVL